MYLQVANLTGNWPVSKIAVVRHNYWIGASFDKIQRSDHIASRGNRHRGLCVWLLDPIKIENFLDFKSKPDFKCRKGIWSNIKSRCSRVAAKKKINFCE